MLSGFCLTLSQSALCHICVHQSPTHRRQFLSREALTSLVVSPVFCTALTRSYRMCSNALTPALTFFLPASRKQIASVTPSSIACVAPCALVGRNGCALSPSKHVLPPSLTHLGSGSRYTSFQSTNFSSGVFETIRLQSGSHPSKTLYTSSSFPGKDHDSSIAPSLWVLHHLFVRKPGSENRISAGLGLVLISKNKLAGL